MNDINNLRFILHVSDFHLSDDRDELEMAKEALKTLTKKLKSEGIKVDYLVHTGDVINSSDLYTVAAEELKIDGMFWEITREDGKTDRKFLYDKYKEIAKSTMEVEKTTDLARTPNVEDLKKFDEKVSALVTARFKEANNVMRTFVKDLNISFGNVVICSGNHDVLRPLSIDENEVICKKVGYDRWEYNCPDVAETVTQPFDAFLNKLGVANCKDRCKENDACTKMCAECGAVAYCTLDDLNVLILNTNWINPKKQKPGYYCVRCDQVIETIEKHSKDVHTRNRLNVILAHKPIYEICEQVRLSYKRYTKTSFLSKLQGFAGDHGIYLCGDKHTRSIVGSYFHDIPHYIGGEPISVQEGHKSEVEYNLLAISDGQVGMERKIHLSNVSGKKWHCEIRPQDDTVKALYKLSRKYVIKNSFEAISNSTTFPSWESLCQVMYNWLEDDKNNWYNNIDQLYNPICRYRINGNPENNDLPKKGIFEFVQERIIEQMKNSSVKNILNIRGEYGSGKSMFLGQFYIHLMMEYSKGKFNFIPAYFNMENKDIHEQIESGVSYYKAVKSAFETFANKVQEIAKKEHQPICYLIDGLDELDCWSYSTEDSVGRGILDILAQYNDAWYVMAFSQHNLPRFKNTMPMRKYNDTSDIMYFNSIDVNEESSMDLRFTSFVKAFLKLRKFPPAPPSKVNSEKEWSDPKKTGKSDDESECQQTSVEDVGQPSDVNLNKQQSTAETVTELKTDELLKDVCNVIRTFRRLTINSDFLFQNYDYLTEINWDKRELQHKDANVTDVYSYYIDRQCELCLNQLGYSFINYAPAMAYLFSYKGYTYEKFKHLHIDGVLSDRHTLKSICKNDDKVYHTFLFIKKNKDAREYLIALHYNRELRYYAEHPNEKIEDGSILNEFITRNIAVLIRKLWTDTNKFVIACEHLLRREDLSNCAQSMLIYCLAHLQMYEPIRNLLQDKMLQKGKETLEKQGLWDDESEQNVTGHPSGKANDQSLWEITGKNDAERLTRFLQLGLKHSMEIFDLIDKKNSLKLVKKYKDDKAFCAYNRQYQMLYYGDLSIKNDANIHPLNPGRDVVYSGFDFHDCFNYLYVKLTSGSSYPLREYDLFTMCDLLASRLDKNSVLEQGSLAGTFFYRTKDQTRACTVLSQAKSILESYCDNAASRKKLKDTGVYNHFDIQKKLIANAYQRVNGKKSENLKQQKTRSIKASNTKSNR